MNLRTAIAALFLLMAFALPLPANAIAVEPDSPGNTCPTAGQGDDSSKCTFICKPGTVTVEGKTHDKDARFDPGRATCGDYVASCYTQHICAASASNPLFSGTGQCYVKVKDPWLNHGWSAECTSTWETEVLSLISSRAVISFDGINVLGLVCLEAECAAVIPTIIEEADGTAFIIG